jgi:hypothetical protein
MAKVKAWVKAHKDVIIAASAGIIVGIVLSLVF